MFINNKIVFDACDRNNVYTFKWKPVANQTLAGGCENSVTRWQNSLSIFGHLETMKNFTAALKVAKLGSKIFQDTK